MAYTPSAFDSTRPVDTDIAETAQLEFRTMKAFYMGTVAKVNSVVGVAGAAPVNVFTVSIPAGILGTTKSIRARITGYITNTTGGAVTVTWNLTYNAVSIMQGVLNIPGNGTFAYEINMDLTNQTATNVQLCWTDSHVFADNSGVGVTQNATQNSAGRNQIAVDSTIAQNLIFITQNSSAVNMTNVMDKAYITWQ